MKVLDNLSGFKVGIKVGKVLALRCVEFCAINVTVFVVEVVKVSNLLGFGVYKNAPC